MNEITVVINKLVNGGQGLGFYQGKPVFVWNALPGETAAIKVTKEKKNYLEGVAVGISNGVPERIEPKEEHYLSCGPWQVMAFAYENYWKRQIAQETFKKIAGLELPEAALVSDQNIFGYRNKMEYSFYPDKSSNKLKFAFHRRGSVELTPIDICLLAKGNINQAAGNILDSLNNAKVGAAKLKSLILRVNRDGRVLASLLVTNKNFTMAPEVIINDILIGFHIYYSNLPRPPQFLRSGGDDFITEELAGKVFKCGPLSFFQVNIAMFEKTLSRISMFIGSDDKLVDFYSGVGAIGLTLSDKVKSGILIESDKAASKLAGANIEFNAARNFSARTGSAERMLSEIKKDKTIIFDPPRAGLHPKVVNKVLEIQPHRIIYLSCDIATQARDIKILSQKYKVKFCELYNYFPRTPHIESLIVLESN